MKKNIKRIFAVFLCAIILTMNILTPVSATTDYSSSKAAAILEIDPNLLEEISTYSITAGAVTTVLASGGGKVVVSTVLVPIISYLVGKGIEVEDTGLPLMEKLALSFFLALDGEWQAALELWAENGCGDIEFTDEMSVAFEDAFRAVFFEDDGTFVKLTGLAFESSLLLEYSSDYIFNSRDETYPEDVFAYPLSANFEQSLGGDTALTARLVMNPMDGVNYGIQIKNWATGVVAVYAVSSLHEDMITNAQSLRISAPAVETREASDGTTLYGINWFVLAEYADGVSDYKLQSFPVGDGDNVVLQNLPNYAYDGEVIALSLNAGATVWQVGDMTWEDICTPGMYVVGTAQPVTQDQEYDEPFVSGDILTMPLLNQLLNMLEFTSEQVRGQTASAKEEAAENTETNEEVEDAKKDATVILKDLFDLYHGGGDKPIGDQLDDFIDETVKSTDDFFGSELWQGILDFFSFMRSLWDCIPAPVTTFITMSVCLFTFIALLKIFIH